MKTRQYLLTVVMALLTTACGGPKIPLNAGVKAVGLDVFYGTPSPTGSTLPNPPYANPFPNFPVPFQGAPRFNTPPPTPHVACPAASPLAFPAEPASITGPLGPPAEATYPYRFKGTLTTEPGTPKQRVIQLPTLGTRQIKDVTEPDEQGAYFYSVVQDWNGVKTTMIYHVYPHGPGGEIATQGAPAAGMYLVQMTDSTGAAFTPAAPGVEVMSYPALESNSFQGAGIDALHQTSMIIDPQGGNHRGQKLVNACGSVVDSMLVEITGKVANLSSGEEKDFALSFNAATQYGSIPVSDHIVENGTDEISGKKFRYDVTATINVVPKSGGS